MAGFSSTGGSDLPHPAARIAAITAASLAVICRMDGDCCKLIQSVTIANPIRAFVVSGFACIRSSLFSPRDDEGVEHEIAPRAKVESEVDRLGHVAVGAHYA